jgi:hypothetical protein
MSVCERACVPSHCPALSHSTRRVAYRKPEPEDASLGHRLVAIEFWGGVEGVRLVSEALHRPEGDARLLLSAKACACYQSQM